MHTAGTDALSQRYATMDVGSLQAGSRGPRQVCMLSQHCYAPGAGGQQSACTQQELTRSKELGYQAAYRLAAQCKDICAC
jgi:hypothetical protein